MARWVGAQGQVNSAKNAKIYPNYDFTHKKTQTQNLNILNKLHTSRIRSLNSSLAQSAGE